MTDFKRLVPGYGALGRTLLLGAMTVSTGAFAAPADSTTSDRQSIEEIVVTGSLIKGTPEDAALPVQVITAADLTLSGSPSALDFVKSLTIEGPTSGSSYYFSGAQLSGDVGFNLRGLGSDRTLTLFNGRRLGGNTTSTVAAGQANTAILPSIAMARVEILKDGAAVTYGADAIGGVVNYITRKRYNGFEIKSSYKTYSGSKSGEWSLGLMGGFGEGNTNVIFAAEWNHRSELDTRSRSFASEPYGVNPAPWSSLTNLAGYVARGPLPAMPGNTANSEWGTPLGLVSDFTPASCNAVGGIYVNNGYTCKYDYSPYYNLVDESNTYRLFMQVNSDISDKTAFHLQVAWAKVHLPHIIGSPAQPVIRGPARTTGAAYQFYVPATNPYVAAFAQRTGWDQSPYHGLTAGYTPVTYRAFAHGGNPAFSVGGNYGMPTVVDNNYLHISSAFEGSFWKDIGYNVALTFNHQTESATFPDVVGYRLQQALYGFGGPDCQAPDLDPNRFGTQNPALAGAGNCAYWNPFASGFKSQPILGLSNPSYIAGAQNPDALARWIFDPREYMNISWNATLDAVFNGTLPVHLPGGDITWGVGGQWRTTQLHDSVPDPLYNGETPCAWPGQNPADTSDPSFSGCTADRPGPFVFFDTNPPDWLTQDQSSYFFELGLPVLNSLYLTAAARHEQFSGNLKTDVYKGSVKWQVFDSFALRGSYGTNFAAPGLGVIPGEITNGVNSYTVASGNWRGAQTLTLKGIKPETATVWSAGGIWQSRGFRDADTVRVLVDYWDIKTKDQLGLLASANDVANAVFSISPNGPGTSIPTNGSALADCASPFAHRVTFNGPCVQGVTTAADFSNITTDYGNGPGQHTSGVDLQVIYGFDALQGQWQLSFNATNTQKFEFSPTLLDGVVLRPTQNRLGHLNFATIAFAAPKWRANFTANYANGPHNARLVLNYISGVDDERYLNADGSVNTAALVPEGYQPGTTNPFPPSYYGIRGQDWISADLHYTLDLKIGTFSASIINLTDRNPPQAREELGYDPRMGNALGRQFQIGFRKEI